MQRALSVVLPFAALMSACINLSLENKHKCASDGDCLIGRICVDQLCQSQGEADATPGEEDDSGIRQVDANFDTNIDSDVDTAVACEDQAVERTACDSDGTSFSSRVCAAGVWSAWGVCESATPCDDGLTEQMACGMNGRGTSKRTCNEGDWSGWTLCEDSDSCIDGARQSKSCGLNGGGTSQRDCANGSWTGWSNCVDLDECHSGDTDSRACGLNLRASQTRTCSAGRWGSFGACEDPDECLDGDAEQRVCGPEGSGLERRLCSLGHWTGWTPCDDPALQETDECKSGQNNCDADPPACKDLPNGGGKFTCECPLGFAGSAVGPAGCVPVLLSLTPSEGTLNEFGPLTTEGQLALGLKTRSVKLRPSAVEGVTITVAGNVVASGTFSNAIALQAGPNTVNVRVTYGEQKRDYTVHIARGDLTAFIKHEEGWLREGSFGNAVALAEDVLVVGDKDEAVIDELEGAITQAGYAYVYLRKNGKFVFTQRLAAAVPGYYDMFGISMATDGSTIAVGARFSSAYRGTASNYRGMVAVYRRQGDTFVPEIELVDPFSNEDTKNVGFGAALAVSGDFLVVGMRSDDHKLDPYGGIVPGERLPGSGAIFLYRRNGGLWEYTGVRKSFETQEDAHFGSSVAFAGQYLIVGAPGQHTTTPSGQITTRSSGAAYVFWQDLEPMSVLRPEVPHEDGMLGTSVATVGDGQVWLVGEPGADTVHTFNTSGKHTTLTPPTAGAMRFGSALALSGDQLLVGAPGENSPTGGIGDPSACDSSTSSCVKDSGAAYLYTFQSSGWALTGFFKAPFPVWGDTFGCAVALDASRGTAVIGNEHEGSSLFGVMSHPPYGCNVSSGLCSVDSGAVYLYE